MGLSVTYLPKEIIHNYYHGVSVLKKLKDQICNAQNRRSSEMSNCLFETYKISYMPHGKHMFPTAYEIVMSKMCAYL